MRLTIAYSKINKRNLVLINNDTYQRETLSERPIRQPLTTLHLSSTIILKMYYLIVTGSVCRLLKVHALPGCPVNKRILFKTHVVFTSAVCKTFIFSTCALSFAHKLVDSHEFCAQAVDIEGSNLHT